MKTRELQLLRQDRVKGKVLYPLNSLLSFH
jgi:hypothetical protein